MSNFFLLFSIFQHGTFLAKSAVEAPPPQPLSGKVFDKDLKPYNKKNHSPCNLHLFP